MDDRHKHGLTDAEACVYLAAPSGRFVTGETLTVNGGGQLWARPGPRGKPSYFSSEDT
jgi:citronellol/citronellal dehydrogenase